jgi:hypothetical protein
VFGVERLVQPKRGRVQSNAVKQLRAGVAAAEAQRYVVVEKAPVKAEEGALIS